MYVPRAAYSFSRSFWTVPARSLAGTPCSSATSSYSARRIGAVALIVIDVDTWASGIAAKSRSISSTESIATPVRPTSPSARGWSESRPICVGRSNATERPVWPCSNRYRKRRFVSSAAPKPAYWRIVHRRPRYIVGYGPRVNGNAPGSPRRSSGSHPSRSRGSYNARSSIPESVTRCSSPIRSPLVEEPQQLQIPPRRRERDVVGRADAVPMHATGQRRERFGIGGAEHVRVSIDVAMRGDHEVGPDLTVERMVDHDVVHGDAVCDQRLELLVRSLAVMGAGQDREDAGRGISVPVVPLRAAADRFTPRPQDRHVVHDRLPRHAQGHGEL